MILFFRNGIYMINSQKDNYDCYNRINVKNLNEIDKLFDNTL